MDGQNFNNDQSNSNYQDNTGSLQTNSQPAGEQKETNALAIVSLILGIIAIICSCCGWVGIIFGIAGIICAVFANKQGKSGLAKAGLICSIVGIALGLILTILVVVMGVGVGMTDALNGYYY